ncbi:hypothetical protein DAEQUDRAFT_815386 [Daedalea quercina L-15889]|uniref:Uncharacterized protein n=1 Tax=Daedalea quercina L-15889 TaxID=1314783 RepID=A0A165L1C3_9APHY|nr:hypothetical protein DAEQUDRAFT_815386 [Daedalea quercina L-15889]
MPTIRFLLTWIGAGALTELLVRKFKVFPLGQVVLHGFTTWSSRRYGLIDAPGVRGCEESNHTIQLSSTATNAEPPSSLPALTAPTVFSNLTISAFLPKVLHEELEIAPTAPTVPPVLSLDIAVTAPVPLEPLSFLLLGQSGSGHTGNSSSVSSPGQSQLEVTPEHVSLGMNSADIFMHSASLWLGLVSILLGFVYIVCLAISKTVLPQDDVNRSTASRDPSETEQRLQQWVRRANRISDRQASCDGRLVDLSVNRQAQSIDGTSSPDAAQNDRVGSQNVPVEPTPAAPQVGSTAPRPPPVRQPGTSHTPASPGVPNDDAVPRTAANAEDRELLELLMNPAIYEMVFHADGDRQDPSGDDRLPGPTIAPTEAPSTLAPTLGTIDGGGKAEASSSSCCNKWELWITAEPARLESYFVGDLVPISRRRYARVRVLVVEDWLSERETERATARFWLFRWLSPRI